MTDAGHPSLHSKKSTTHHSSERATKVVWVDALKGIGIILVVFGHALRGAYGRDLVPTEIFQAIDVRIYSFHMPLFFVVSGLFLHQTLMRTTPQSFLRILLERILYPLVLWTYIFLFFKYLAGDHANSPVTLKDIFVLPFPGQEHLWFLWALLLSQLLVFLAYLAVPHLSSLWFALGLLALSIGLFFSTMPAAWAPWIGSTIQSLPFLAFGLLIGTQLSKISVPVAIGVVGGGLCASAIWVVPMINSQLLFPATIISLLGCVTFAFQHSAIMRYMAFVGQASMAIYLTHTILSAACRAALLTANITDSIVHLTTATAVGLFGGLAIHHIAHRIGINRWLGFR